MEHSWKSILALAAFVGVALGATVGNGAGRGVASSRPTPAPQTSSSSSGALGGSLYGQHHCQPGEWLWSDGKCYTFGTQGPCEEGSFLLFDRTSPAAQLTCIKKKCSDDFHIHWGADGQCHHYRNDVQKNKLCGKGNELITDVFGEGVCSCIKSPPHAIRPGYPDKNCYALFNQGPCAAEEALLPVPAQTPTGYELVCVKNPCKEDGMGWREEDQKCYKFGEQGPCKTGEVFQVHPVSIRPQCVDQYLLWAPEDCVKSEDCRAALAKPAQPTTTTTS